MRLRSKKKNRYEKQKFKTSDLGSETKDSKVRLLAMCRDELSAVIRLMYKYL